MDDDEVRARAIGAIRDWMGGEDRCFCPDCEQRVLDRAGDLLDYLWDYGVTIEAAAVTPEV
jgi:hypothetical protein